MTADRNQPDEWAFSRQFDRFDWQAYPVDPLKAMFCTIVEDLIVSIQKAALGMESKPEDLPR